MLVAVAAIASLVVLRPPAAAARDVVSAAADLPAGHALSAADLVSTRLPVAVVPPSAVAQGDRQQLVGGVLTAPLGRGELVTTARTLGPGVLQGAPRGTLAVPVALAQALPDGAVRAGDSVAVIVAAPQERAADVVGPSGVTGGADLAPGGPAPADPGFGALPPVVPQTAELLVERAVVLMPPPSTADATLVGGGDAPVAVLALSAAQAQAVADAGAERPLTLGVVAAR